MPKILIATPAYGEVFYTPYVSSIFSLTRMLERRKWGSNFVAISFAEIAESRNYLLTFWYDKTDASHILFIDADMGFESALIARMVEFDKPVVGTVYPKRQLNVNRIATLAARGEQIDRAIVKGHEFVIQPARGKALRIQKGFVEVEGCGAGILLIQRFCVDSMLQRIPELSDADVKYENSLAKDLGRVIRAFDVLRVDGRRVSEDFAFCHRWRSICGGEIWANVEHEITHIGLREFKARYADRMGGGHLLLLEGGGREGRVGVGHGSAKG